MGPAVLLAAVVVGVVLLARLHRRAATRAVAERSGMLDDVAGLLDDVHRSTDPAGLPCLVGTHDGHRHTVRLVVDSLTLRKLPVLWLEVTAHRSLPLPGPLVVLRRPQGTEFFSPDHAFGHEIALPDGWPRPSRLSTTGPDRTPDPAVLDPALPLLRDPATKEVAVGPRGARVVRLAAECEQAQYRTARRAVFGPVRVPREEVRAVVDVLAALGGQAHAIPQPAVARSGP